MLMIPISENLKNFRSRSIRVGKDVYDSIAEVRYYFEDGKLVHVSGDTGKLMALVPIGGSMEDGKIVFVFGAINYLDWTFISVDSERTNLKFMIPKKRRKLLATFNYFSKRKSKMSSLKKIIKKLRDEIMNDL